MCVCVCVCVCVCGNRQKARRDPVCVVRDPVCARVCVLKHGKGKKIILIVDGHPVHKAKAVTRWIADQAGAITLHFLPGYAPELNPDELLNHDLKLGLAKHRPKNRHELKLAVRSHLHKRQKQPNVIKRFFHAKHVRYAA